MAYRELQIRKSILVGLKPKYKPKPSCIRCGGKGYQDHKYFFSGCYCLMFPHSVSDDAEEINASCKVSENPPKEEARRSQMEMFFTRMWEHYREVGANDKDDNRWNEEEYLSE